jgi:hypothetical protein
LEPAQESPHIGSALFGGVSSDGLSLGEGPGLSKWRKPDYYSFTARLNLKIECAGGKMMDNPTREDWAKLYQAAIEFQKVSPWTWMRNEDLFAVEDAESGEMGYCSIMGEAKIEFGLSIMLGEKGYKSYLELSAREDESEDFEEGIVTPMLSLLFVSRTQLKKQDLEVIRSLGLQFRGNGAWPYFRSQRPGYVPWFLEKKEAVFLTDALEQSLAVCEEVKNKKLDLFEEADENLVLTRSFRHGKWVEEWREPKISPRDLSPENEAAELINEADLVLLHNATNKLVGRWEADIFVLPMSILTADSRPAVPSCFLVVDRERGHILDAHITESWLTLPQKREIVIRLLKKARPLPREIWVRSQKVSEILAPIAASLGIELQVGPTPALEEAKAALHERFAGGR